MPSDSAIESLPLAELEEAAGELHRRIGEALRALGERRADRAPRDGRSPRWHVASLVAAIELAAQVLSSVAASASPPIVRVDRHPPTVAATMYAAPTVPALLARMEQNRRLLASLARNLESRLDEQHGTPWGTRSLRSLVAEVTLLEGSRCALAVEAAAYAGEA